MGQEQSIGLTTRAATYRWNLAVLECGCDAVDLELPVHVGLLDLHVDWFVDVGHDYFCSWCWNHCWDSRESINGEMEWRLEKNCLGIKKGVLGWGITSLGRE